MIRTAYVRYRGAEPESINTATAELGFSEIGIKTVPFQGFGDITTDVKCGPEALVCGFIQDVYAALNKLKLPRPPSIDYPVELEAFYGRKIWSGTLDDIQDRGIHPGVFVKPHEQKLFTGFLWRGSPWCRRNLAPYEKATPVFFAEPVDFVSEYRCFVLDGEIVDVKRYRGDWSKAPARDVVEAAVKAYQPYRGYAIDFGVIDDGRTVVVEVNDSFALGCYGLRPIEYARILEARWEELTGGSG